MVAVLILGLTPTFFYLRGQQPTYRARATVLVTSQRISEEFFRPTVESDQLEKISAIVGELLSRQKLSKLIQEYNLYPSGERREPLTMENKVAIMRSNITLGPDQSSTANQNQDSSAVVYEFTYRSPRSREGSAHHQRARERFQRCASSNSQSTSPLDD